MTGVERNHAGAVTGARRTCTGLRFAAVGSFLLAPGHAAAGEMDWLRGSFTSASYSRWDGVNFGVGFGLTNQHTDFGSATSSEVAFILRNTTLENEAHPSDWTTLPANSTNGRNYGAVSRLQRTVGSTRARRRRRPTIARSSSAILRAIRWLGA